MLTGRMEGLGTLGGRDRCSAVFCACFRRSFTVDGNFGGGRSMRSCKERDEISFAQNHCSGLVSLVSFYLERMCIPVFYFKY